MNLRQKAKKLKQHNDFLQHIINSEPELKHIYEQMKKPLHISTSYRELKRFKCTMYLPPEHINNGDFIKYCKDKLATELMDGIKQYIEYSFDLHSLAMDASIYVAKL